jgi:hypothetical protein
MVEFALCAVAFLVVLLFLIGLVTQIQYRVTSRHLEVRLGGICLRRLDLADIDRVSKRRASFCEAWPNTLQTRKRVLVIRRRSGRVREFLITPEQRYVFRHRLKIAVAAARGETEAPLTAEERAEEAEDRIEE